MRLSAGWLALLLACPAGADELQRAHMADLAGVERLRLFTYGKLLETGAAPRAAVQQMKADMTRQGFYLDSSSTRLIARDAWATPVLEYDGNINGGVLRDSFRYGAYVFEAAPEFQAKRGAVVGVAAGGATRLAWDSGRYLELAVQGEAVWSPRFDIGRSSTGVQLCSRNHVEGWTFVDLCQSGSSAIRDLGSSRATTTALSVSQLFASAEGDHQITASLSQTNLDIGTQLAGNLAWDAVWNGAATNLSLTLGAPVADQTAMRQRLEGWVTWAVAGHSVGIDLWQQQASGGNFLASSRTDRSRGVAVTYNIRPGLSTEIGYEVNQSTIELFRYDQVTLNLRFQALRW